MLYFRYVSYMKQTVTFVYFVSHLCLAFLLSAKIVFDFVDFGLRLQALEKNIK